MKGVRRSLIDYCDIIARFFLSNLTSHFDPDGRGMNRNEEALVHLTSFRPDIFIKLNTEFLENMARGEDLNRCN